MPPLLLLPVLLLFATADGYSSTCSNSTCGELTIAYPFWLNSSTAAASSCGVHGLGLACEDNTTLITLAQSQHPYRVSRIDYDTHTIFLVDDAQPKAFNTAGCPHLHFNLTIDPGTPLQLTHSDSNITFFYNCKKNASWPSAVELIGCPDNKTSSYVFSGDGYTGEPYEYGCEAAVVAPVLDSHKKSMADAPPATRYLEVLKGGFELNYSPKSDECGICERSGGWCGYGRNQTQGGMAVTCFCADGRSTTDHCGGHKNTNLLKVVLPIIACLLILACIAFVRIWKYKASKRQKKEMHKRLVLGYLNASNETRGENVEFSFFSFEDIAAATDNFSVSKQIGRGGFGKVYKGKLKGVSEVAIKRLSKDSGQGIDEFKNEIVLIAKLQHRNLVRLLGCCIHEDERLLVYEYLPNKSLDGVLFAATKQYVLDWPTRFEIVKGVARGLLYLHQDSRLTIIHRDLKASNILLDSEMTPKISDFGMARIFCRNQHHANTNRVVGTYGYMSPEYVMGGAFSVKSDTYSFGVLLLEIVSGLKISSPQLIMNFVSLTTYAWRLWEDGKAIELVDSSVIEKCPLHEVLRCIHVGLLCVQDRPDDRPLISSVIFMLDNGGALLPAPKQPAYSAIPVCETEQLRENMENSVNKVSITTLVGR